MGALTSRQNAGVEEVDIGSNHAYKYPPRCGEYVNMHACVPVSCFNLEHLRTSPTQPWEQVQFRVSRVKCA